MSSSPAPASKIAGTCDPVLAKIQMLKGLLSQAEEALSAAEGANRPILEVGIAAIRGELSRSSRRLRLVS